MKLKVDLLGLAFGLCAQAAKLYEVAVPSCDSFQCDLDKGWSPRPNHFKIKGNSKEECCIPTCRQWTCGHGFKAHPDYYDNVASSNIECCDRLCSSVACNASSAVPMSKKNTLGSTPEECCTPLCSKHLCVGSWVMDPLRNHQAGSSNEECCTVSCAALTCDSSNGLKVIAERNDRAQPKKNPEDFCCEKTCAYFKDQCGEGLGMDISNELKMAQTAEANNFHGKCCEPFCSGMKCPAGHVLNPTKAAYLVSKVNAGGCCLPTCETFKCSAGWVKNPATANFVAASLRDKDCCLATCAKHACGAGWFNSTDPIQLSKVRSSDSACCKPSCNKFQCPEGSALKPSAANISMLSASSCCESSLCGALRSKNKVQYCNSVSDEVACNASYDVQSNRSSIAPCAWSSTYKICRMNETSVLKCDQ